MGRDWWGRRVWNSLVGGFHRLFQRKGRSRPLTVSDTTNSMDSAQTLHGNCKLVQTHLPSQQDKEDDISSPTLMSTPFSQSLTCLLYTSPSPRDATLSRMPSSA